MPPLSLLIKPASGLCNLRCRYCFYVDEMSMRETASYGIMSDETLEIILRRVFDDAPDSVTLAFQGGEPTLAGLEYFRHAVALSQQFNHANLPVHYVLQTNGMLLDEQWASFFAENHFLVGLSLDGFQEIHDKNRIRPDGSGSFDTVMDKVELLKKYHVEFNILSVVTRQTAGSAGKIFRFFEEHGLSYQQYIPCLDPFEETRGHCDYSLTPQKYEHFLKTLFDQWYKVINQGNYVHNLYFENLVGMLLLQPPRSCGMIGHCSEQNVVEADGSVYPCDFYVLDQFCLGNLHTDSFEDIRRRCEEIGFIQQSMEVHPACQACRWYPICRGGCRRDRQQADGTLGLNYYCSAYKGFFAYVMPRLERIAGMIQAGWHF